MLEQIEKLSRYRTIEQGTSNIATVAISVTRAKLYCINTWYAQADRETVEVSNYRAGTSKLLQYRSLEQSYTVLTHGMLKQIKKLSRYRTIEQGLQNCRNIGHSRPKNCRGIELSSRDFKTVEHIEHIEQGLENCLAYRAGT